MTHTPRTNTSNPPPGWRLSPLTGLPPRLLQPDHGMFPPIGSGQSALLAAEAMDLGVEHLKLHQFDKALDWFTHAATRHYPGADAVRDAVASLRDKSAAALSANLGANPATRDNRQQQAIQEAIPDVAEHLHLAAAAAAAALNDQANRIPTTRNSGETA